MIDQFIKQLGSGLEHTVDILGKLPKEEIQTQLHQVAKNTLTKMDLVTREEFELQAAMLGKYRERLVMLEARIAELEKTADASEPKKAPAKRASAKQTVAKADTDEK
ncbi:accessory factor UbiK family protein [Marinomonas sp. TI.3.20]|uniref:accessory factor UbiK family protein n=1 Tax=Marinomonas sp. TI.3.20 TaxID=3121296 RepID=UPI00311E9C04